MSNVNVKKVTMTYYFSVDAPEGAMRSHAEHLAKEFLAGDENNALGLPVFAVETIEVPEEDALPGQF